MAQIILTIPNDRLQRVIDGICYLGDYQDTIHNPSNYDEMIPNPVSKAAFAKQYIIDKVREMVLTGEANKARQTIVLDNTPLDIT